MLAQLTAPGFLTTNYSSTSQKCKDFRLIVRTDVYHSSSSSYLIIPDYDVPVGCSCAFRVQIRIVLLLPIETCHHFCAYSVVRRREGEQRVITCPKYANLRNTLFSKNNNKSFNQLSDSNKFNWLMCMEDMRIIRELAIYLLNCFQLRST